MNVHNFNCKQFVNFKISGTVSNKTTEFIVHVVIYIVFLPVIEWLDSAVCVHFARECVEAFTGMLVSPSECRYTWPVYLCRLTHRMCINLKVAIY